MSPRSLKIIDSHTEGEPTRVVVSGAPDLGNGPLADRARRLREEHDWLRSSVCNEPRGHEAMVGALLCEPHEPDCVCGVIFFNSSFTTLAMALPFAAACSAVQLMLMAVEMQRPTIALLALKSLLASSIILVRSSGCRLLSVTLCLR